MALSFGCDPLPAVRLSQPITAKSEKESPCNNEVQYEPPGQCKPPLSEKKCRIKGKTMLHESAKEVSHEENAQKEKVRRSCKKNAQSFIHGSTIISKKDCDTRGVWGNVSHPEGETHDYDRD